MWADEGDRGQWAETLDHGNTEGRFPVLRSLRASVIHDDLVALVERILELNRRLKGAMERGAIEVRWQHGWAESRRGTIPCPP